MVGGGEKKQPAIRYYWLCTPLGIFRREKQSSVVSSDVVAVPGVGLKY